MRFVYYIYQLFFKALNELSVNKHGNITCKIFHHCKIPCSNKPNCQPINECKFEWKIGKGTINTIKTNENVIIDSKGKNNFSIFFCNFVYTGFFKIINYLFCIWILYIQLIFLVSFKLSNVLGFSIKKVFSMYILSNSF